jgi:putative FmdB family regulatory protein
MPTYEYECPKGHRFDVFQRMTDKPVATCPKCKARARRKISGGAGFLFKGEGFYITDYRSEDYKKRASAESASVSEKSTKPEAPEKAKSEGSKSEGTKGKGRAKPKPSKTSSEA